MKSDPVSQNSCSHHHLKNTFCRPMFCFLHPWLEIWGAGWVCGCTGHKSDQLTPLGAAEFIWGCAQGNKNQPCKAKHQTLTESSLSYLKLFKFSGVTKMSLSALIQNQWRCQKNRKGQMKFRDVLMFVPKAWDHELSKQWWSHLLLPIIKISASNICFSTSVMNTCGLHLMIDWHIF